VKNRGSLNGRTALNGVLLVRVVCRSVGRLHRGVQQCMCAPLLRCSIYICDHAEPQNVAIRDAGLSGAQDHWIDFFQISDPASSKIILFAALRFNAFLLQEFFGFGFSFLASQPAKVAQRPLITDSGGAILLTHRLFGFSSEGSSRWTFAFTSQVPCNRSSSSRAADM